MIQIGFSVEGTHTSCPVKLRSEDAIRSQIGYGRFGVVRLVNGRFDSLVSTHTSRNAATVAAIDAAISEAAGGGVVFDPIFHCRLESGRRYAGLEEIRSRLAE